jgi:ribonuclease BN (tRNA processing enzyme)
VTRVAFVGSGDAFGSGGRRQTCIGLSGDDQFMLVDCGATSVLGLKALGLDPSLVSAVVISHLHGDHFGGLPFLILDGQFSGRTQPFAGSGSAGNPGPAGPGDGGSVSRFESGAAQVPG